MPNHVYTTVTIDGDKARIAEFFAKHFRTVDDWQGEPVQQFDFNTFFPMPEELEGTTSPNTPPRVDGVQVSKDSTQYKVWKKTSDNLREKYGTDNWYDWCINNWGTKWNSYENQVNLDSNCFSFQTAWGLPEPILHEMAKLYPDLSFVINTVEEGGYFSGTMLISEGTVDYSGIVQNNYEEWRHHAWEFLGWEFDDEE